MGQNYLIPVIVSAGMFSTEYAIKLALADGNIVSFFADKSLVKDYEGQKYLNVTFVNENKERNTIVVLLPVEPFEGSRWAEVNKAEEVAA